MRQVLIETRVVIVNDDYSRELGVRFGSTSANDNSGNGLIGMTGTAVGSGLHGRRRRRSARPPARPCRSPRRRFASRYNVNLPVASPAGSIALAILGNDYLVDLELSALQAEGDGRVVSTPRIVATNQREARILQGTEIPYQESSSSGATTVSFKEAVLSLTVIAADHARRPHHHGPDGHEGLGRRGGVERPGRRLHPEHRYARARDSSPSSTTARRSCSAASTRRSCAIP